MKTLEDYRKIIGDDLVSELYRKARPLNGVRFLHINSTYYGGGVAEILNSLIPLLNDVGIESDWRILRGSPDFFNTTKKFHNALQGEKINLSKNKIDTYINANSEFARYCRIDHDFVIIHDPQPLPLIKFYKKRQPFIWRCHIDLSNPNRDLFDYLKNFIFRYDVVVVSNEKFKQPDLPVEYKVIYPAIDPATIKNIDLPNGSREKYLKKFFIPTDKPIISQISRFDKWKDPEGVLEIFKMVKEKVDCRLILCGSMATDDPEGIEIFEKVRKKAKKEMESGDVFLITMESNLFVNLIQRISSVIIQKSLKEGFGLTVTEALWKGTPVVASSVGGIKLQIKDGEHGFLVEPMDYKGFAEKIVYLLKNPNIAEEFSKKGKEFVKKNYLITRLLSDYINLLNELK